MENTQQNGALILKEYLKNLPQRPGVYRMYNDAQEVLYIGKALNLKKRVAQYTQVERLPRRLQQMVFLTRKLEVVETTSEVEALLLEANLIKSLKPRYNIRLKDDGSYPGIYITPPLALGEPVPQLKIQRGKKPKKGHYFGPYPSGHSAYKMVDLLERLFKLRTCRDGFYKTRKRPCLKYHIQRCSGPCVGHVSPQEYQKQINHTVLFLEGKAKDIQKNLQQEMQHAAQEGAFEKAALFRDRLSTLADALTNQTTTSTDLHDADIIALLQLGGKTVIQIFSYRHGQHVGNSRHFPEGVDHLTPAEATAAFISLYYSTNTPPKGLFLNHLPENAKTLSAALSQAKKATVHIHVPKRGEKAEIMAQAEANAQAALSRRQAQNQQQEETLKAFAEVLNYPDPIERIECFDVSNIQGRDPVASLVVMTPEGIAKNGLRKFAIKTKDRPDDYAMMHEVLKRRYGRLLKEQKNGEGWPQVVMVDGGKGHLNTLEKVFEELEIDAQSYGIVLCAIAKGEERDKGLERIFKAGAPNPLPIPFNSSLIFMLQRLRDEAHRVAIGYHRQKRSKKLKTSILDSIPNIGPKRKKALLQHFGSVPQLKRASLKDIAQVEGISEALASEIFTALH